MKLRNKKTGEIVEYDSVGFRKGQSNGWDDFIPNADSLTALNEVWEDYTPAEPLIKDEKIRKAVRAWADADGADEKIYLTIDENGTRFANKYGGYIEFAFMADYEEGLYTIAELCGEEEE